MKAAKKTPHKKMPEAQKGKGGYAPKGPKGAVKKTGKKKMPSAKKSKIEDKVSKIKF